MYIARINRGGRTRYLIRESVPDPTGKYFLSRDLFDLGADPTEFIHYTGRDSFYLDPALEDAINRQKNPAGATDPEDLFQPFLTAEARRRAEFFSHKYRNFTSAKLGAEEIDRLDRQVHLFDKKRLHYLRYGSLSQARLHKAPLKLFRPLLCKSRDELEQYFLGQEAVLEPNEFRQYAYVIFDLQGSFAETAARVLPEALDQDKLAEVFEKEFCRLFGERSFAGGLAERDLTAYLSRYVIMFFDYAFPAGAFAEDYARQFRDSHRSFAFPRKEVVISDREAEELFGVSRAELVKMSKSGLTGLYRKLAHEHHPDKGGEHDNFVRLTEIYLEIRKSKK
jgi:hypothetical protein